MFRSLFLFFLFVGLISADTECPIVTSIGDRRADKSKLRLVQYNVEWLFIDYYSSANCPGSGCSWHNQTAANTHLSYVSKVFSMFLKYVSYFFFLSVDSI